MRIVIPGGTGLIGRPLSAALAAAGHHVTVLSRNPTQSKKMPDGVEVATWDGKTADGWGHLADGADAIINLAGAGIADGRWSEDRKRLIRESRQQAGQAVMEAMSAAAQKPKVLVQASAVGYYGTHEDEVITEAHAPGSDFLSTVCFDWEASTASAVRMGVRRAVIRTGIVLSNDGGAFPKMVLPFKLFAGGPLGGGKQWLPWIHIRDEVRAIQFLVENAQASGPFNLAAPTPVTNAEFGAKLGKVMGRPAFMPAPAFAMRTALGEMSMLLLEGQRAVPTRLQELGFQFEFAKLEDALADLVGQSVEKAA